MRKLGAVGAKIAILLSAALLWAGEPWKEKPSTEWSIEDLFKIDQDSPWSKPLFITTGPVRRQVIRDTSAPPRVVPIYNQYGAIVGYKMEDRQRVEISAPQEIVVVQWASSLTLRQARVRQAQLKGMPVEEQEPERLEAPPENNAVSVRGSWLRPVLESLAQAAADSATQSVYLKPKRSKEIIHAHDFEVLMEGEPEALFVGEPTVWFYFPRELDGRPTIGPYEEKVEFRWEMVQPAISVTFDLRKMIRDGKPDL